MAYIQQEGPNRAGIHSTEVKLWRNCCKEGTHPAEIHSARDTRSRNRLSKRLHSEGVASVRARTQQDGASRALEEAQSLRSRRVLATLLGMSFRFATQSALLEGQATRRRRPVGRGFSYPRCR